MEINDPTHLTGHVWVDASRDEEKYQGFTLSGCLPPEEDRRGDRHLSGTRQRLCVDIYHVILFFYFFRFPTTVTVPSATHTFSSRKDAVTSLEFHHCSDCTVISFLTACPSPDGAVTHSVVLLHKSFHTSFLVVLPVPIFNTWYTPTL